MKQSWIFLLFFVPAIFIPSVLFAKTLPVPFTSQAPFGNWAEPWHNACEETAIAMVNAFYAGQTFPSKTAARDAILSVFKIKNKLIGWSLDENAKQMAVLINNFLPWETVVVADPTLEQIKAEIDENRPVIVPVYGRALGNPYFTAPGPVYHTLVISGYDDEKHEFITEEPGTRRGLDYRYSYDTLMNALHDYMPRGQTKNGAKVALFTRTDLETSGDTDGDKDGLTKADEIKHGSLLTSKDTDRDGFADGMEVAHGYSPTSKTKTKL